ncbi:sugar ABC transporter permease [Acidocella sp. MX-AZ03]|uniref:ABC transporter permease n=1 Tax=Acidocella sp. MX-AZ03 TaxID=2697363 RepID=UPI0022DD726C|nr:sugar ABC transporter permease [Acidocella sp. MX-AZ03]WBO60072.1 sugar ABC transporter permease [Acidocella sp. MX-AZ03]
MERAPLTAPAAPDHVSLSQRLARRGLDVTTLLLMPALLFVLALFVYPALYGFWLSLHPMNANGVFGFGNYIVFFSDRYVYGTIFTTLELAVPVTLVNIALSVPIALRVRHLRKQRLLTTILIIPVTLGTVLTAQGMLNFYGPLGWFNRILMTLHVIDAPVRLVHNFTGVFLSQIVSGFPFCFMLILSYVSGIDPSLEQAASMLGAGPAARFRHILLPLLGLGWRSPSALPSCRPSRCFPRRCWWARPPAPPASSPSPPITRPMNNMIIRWARPSPSSWDWCRSSSSPS